MSDALDLIVEAEATLRRDIAPGGPDARYHALLAANALAMAQRELARPSQDVTADVAAIRAGAHDHDADLHARLLAAARLRAWIALRKVVGATMRRRWRNSGLPRVSRRRSSTEALSGATSRSGRSCE